MPTALRFYPNGDLSSATGLGVPSPKFGRKPVLDAGQRKRLAESYAAGETMAALAREYDCGEAIFQMSVKRVPTHRLRGALSIKAKVGTAVDIA